VFWLPNVRPSKGDLHQSSGLPPRNWVDYIVVLRTLIANLLEYDTSRMSGNCRRRAIPAMDRASNAELIMLGARCDRVWQTRHKDECGTGSLPGNHDEVWYRPQSFMWRVGRLLIVLASVFRPRVRFSSGGGALADRNPRQAPAAPKTRQVHLLGAHPPDRLGPVGQARLDAARAQCPHLDDLARHVRAFAQIMTPAWARPSSKTGSPGPSPGPAPATSFSRGIRRDQSAVTAGLTLPYGSAALESKVNKIKMMPAAEITGPAALGDPHGRLPLARTRPHSPTRRQADLSQDSSSAVTGRALLGRGARAAVSPPRSAAASPDRTRWVPVGQGCASCRTSCGQPERSTLVIGVQVPAASSPSGLDASAECSLTRIGSLLLPRGAFSQLMRDSSGSQPRSGPSWNGSAILPFTRAITCPSRPGSQ
jgi:hypothetical protein